MKYGPTPNNVSIKGLLPCAVVASSKSSYFSTNLCIMSVASSPNRTASFSTEAQLMKIAQN